MNTEITDKKALVNIPGLDCACVGYGRGPVLMISLGVFLCGALLPCPAWVRMWVVALMLYAAFKHLSYDAALSEGLRISKIARFFYLFCWPGMSPREFARRPATRCSREWMREGMAAVGKTLIGVGCVWWGVPLIPSDAWWVRGWIGMVGMVLILHFGIFHILALALQALGFNAHPVMRSPLLAQSLADFWGNRWNTAFRTLANRFGFRPLTPRIGAHAALVVVFFVSGLIHELVISIPAGGGYGLPTAYFTLQAAGLLLERRAWFRTHPRVKRFLMWVVLIAPVGGLFPPIFIQNIILPMLDAMGVTGGIR